MKKLKIAVILSLFIVSFSSVVLSSAIEFEGKIQKNIYLKDINISNLTKKQAKNKINKYLEDNNSFFLKLNDEKILFSKDYIDVDYNVDEVVEKAYSIGRSEGIISNLKTRSNLKMGKKVILDYNIVYDEKKLDKYLKQLNKKVYIKPKNASIKVQNGTVVVSKEKFGYKLDKEKLKNIIIKKIKDINNDEEEIPIVKITPLCLYKDLININTVLGRFETYFNPKNYNRATNIKLSSEATNNTLLNPGELFSFNSKMKNSDINKYLKEAPVIINGKPDRGIGGGMCQVSSTIYNTALYSGMKIVSVRNHSIPSPYIEKGRDATISGEIIDLKFINPYSTPVFIHNEVLGNKIVCTIYGKENDYKDIEILTEVTDVIYNKIVKKNSEKYELGIKNIEQEGRKGYRVKTYRRYKDNNKLETISESYYPPQDTIIIYGTRELRK